MNNIDIAYAKAATAYLVSQGSDGGPAFYAGFGAGAEWARKEALKEAAQSIHDWGSVMAGPEGAYFARIFESRLRTITEEVGS